MSCAGRRRPRLDAVGRTETRPAGGGHTCRLPKRAFVSVVTAWALTLTACGISGLSFVQDDRVDILGPKDRAEVTLPVRIAWEVKDFDVGAGAGSFGVFVDRAPQRPGKTLSWIFRGDDSCKGAAGRAICDDPDFLRQRNVFQTTDTHLTVDLVPKLTGQERRRQFHEATIVLLDEEGRRVGEGAWSVQFELKAND